jgi:hypothetical protein
MFLSLIVYKFITFGVLQSFIFIRQTSLHVITVLEMNWLINFRLTDF